MQNRSKLPQIYIEFQKMIQTQFSRSIKIFRSDNAKEYRESSFLVTLKQNGTIPHHSCPSTFQQNGCAERKHRHIFLLLFQNRFEMKLFSLRFTQSIVFLRLSHTISRPMSCSIGKFLIVTRLWCSGVCVLFFFNLMNIESYNLVLVCDVF